MFAVYPLDTLGVPRSTVSEPAMSSPFDDFDLSDFWEDSEYSRREYEDDPLTAEKIATVEMALGYRLPATYIALSQLQNGGIVRKDCHRTSTRTSWAEDHIAITGILAIGHSKPFALLGSFGSDFWITEWGYPPIGIYFADCPSAGHDMVCLDYRACGPTGEPSIVHVDQERDYAITHLADTFESFIRGLESSENFD